ncbi:magnesium-translocating P-type ATPase [Actinomadura miaoliensis]|uniref:magnesium-translocating P-type ATPase n=1 Tax=Actinomadura miaoliensis TaxID=430685 RepID=UPI0031F0ED67
MRAALAGYAGEPALAVLRRWDTSPRGLDENEAQDRLLRFGEGADGSARDGGTRRPVRAAAAPFVVVLICLGLVSALVGDARGTVLICCLAVLSGALRFRQEARSDRAAAALRTMATTTATVLRRAAPGADPVPREVPAEQVVPGDIVLLGPGDVVPADLRLLSSSGLTVDQSALTGESLPAGKHATWAEGPLPAPPAGGPEPDVFGHPRLCLTGTTVVAGTGTAVAVATGTATYVGATGDLPARPPETAFDRGVRAVSWGLVAAMLTALPLVLAAGGALRGDWSRALPTAVAVAVAVTPEMLPLVATALLVRGAAGLSRRQVIVKRLPAVHNLGAMDTLCVDKTGTLTERHLRPACHLDPDGGADPGVLRWARLNALWSVELSGSPDGDAVDEALLRDAGDLAGFEGADVIPFDFTRRRATVLLRPDDPRPRSRAAHVLVTKGAVEDVLDVCVRVRTRDGEVALDAAERARLLAMGDRWAADGVRLLAVATARRAAPARSLSPADERDLTLVGFVGFRDRPDPAAAAAVRALARRGVDLIMITGDHPEVARRVCRDAGLPVSRVVLGRDLAGLDDAELARLAGPATVFARVAPAQKARVVRALRRAGRTVGYLGDGVNDAPALRAADVGVTVAGAAGPARAAADVILARGGLGALEQAVVAGRRTFANTVKYIKIALTSNVGNVASILAAAATLPFPAMPPLQVLVRNVCFDLSQLALVHDRVDESQILRPRTFDHLDLARFVACVGPVGALFDLAVFGLLWRVPAAHGPGGQQLVHTGWFVANLTAQGLAMLLLRSRGRGAPRAAWPVLAAAAAPALCGLLLPFSPLAATLDLRPLPLAALPPLAVVVTGYLAATIGVRALYQRLFGRWL